MWSLIYLNMRKEAEPNKTKQKKLISVIHCEKKPNFLCHFIVYGLITLVIKSMCRGLKLGKAAKLMKTQLKSKISVLHIFSKLSSGLDWSPYGLLQSSLQSSRQALGLMFDTPHLVNIHHL